VFCYNAQAKEKEGVGRNLVSPATSVPDQKLLPTLTNPNINRSSVRSTISHEITSKVLSHAPIYGLLLYHNRNETLLKTHIEDPLAQMAKK
jgi:hypothetical protein